MRSLIVALSLALIAVALTGRAQAATHWRWTCQGEGFRASGQLTTTDAPNADGFYEITTITGQANGVTITGLQPTGTAVPLNEGYPVDNLVRQAAPQLSSHGFGFALDGKTFANPFWGAHFATPGWYAFLSDPSAGKTREPRVTFTAERIR